MILEGLKYEPWIPTGIPKPIALMSEGGSHLEIWFYLSGGSIRINPGNPPPIVTTAIPGQESRQTNRNVLIGKLHQDKQVLELNELRKAQKNEARIAEEEIEIPLDDPNEVFSWCFNNFATMVGMVTKFDFWLSLFSSH